MLKRLILVAASLTLMAAPAAAQAPASAPVEVLDVELDVDGRTATSVTQVSVSGVIAAADAGYGPIVLTVTSNFVGAADRTLEAWFEQGVNAPQRTLALRLINRLGRAATYEFQECRLATRSFAAPNYSGGFMQENWSINCATMRRV